MKITFSACPRMESTSFLAAHVRLICTTSRYATRASPLVTHFFVFRTELYFNFCASSHRGMRCCTASALPAAALSHYGGSPQL